jgi:predicted Zn-dependent peptidase
VGCAIVLSLLSLAVPAQPLEVQKKVTGFILPNGMHFVVAERHEAPVASMHTYVRAGAVDNPGGQTGLAHMFEPLAMRGTESIGTRDWAAEKKAIDAVDEAYGRLEAEKNRPNPDLGRVGAAEIQFKRAQEVALSYVRTGEFGRILGENGAAGMAANVTADSSEFAYSLPSNRLELWFLMESQRLLRPAFREFYLARDFSVEQYRERVESNPQNRLAQAFLAAAITAHPYRNPVLGWPGEPASLRRQQARDFFDQYYVPANITIALAGDVNPAEVRRMAERYFGPMPLRPAPPAVHTEEPPQRGPKTVAVESPSQPLLMIGYKRPGQLDPDHAALELLHAMLAGGRSGLLYKELVVERKVAIAAQAQAAFPGSRYPSLFAFILAPAQGHSAEENQAALDAILSRLGTARVDPEILARAKRQVRAATLRRLEDNAGMALLLATYAAASGDPNRLFTALDDSDKVTVADVQRVARKYFTANTRTTAYITPPQGRAITAAPGANR